MNIPTTDNVNILTGGIDLWLRNLGYSLEYTERGPQVGMTALAIRQQYSGGEMTTVNVYTDVTEEWVWNVSIVTLDADGEEISKESVEVRTESEKEVGREVKEKLLKPLPRNHWKPLTFESVFREKLLTSSVYYIDEQFDDWFIK